MKQQSKAYAYALSAVLCWSTVATAFKISLRYLDFLQLLLYSSAASTGVLFLILYHRNKVRELLSYSRREYARSALLGFLNPFLYYVVLFKAYSILPAQEAQPLNYTWPVMIVILSIPLLKQPIGPLNVLAVLVSFSGVVIISTHGAVLSMRFSNPFGVSLAVGSSVIWALFWIYNVRDRRDEVAKLFLNFAFGTLFTFGATAAYSDWRVSEIEGLLGAAYVGTFEMGLTFVFWLMAMKLSRTTAQVSNLIFISPFASLFFIRFIVGERILPSTVAGLAFIIGGIVVQQYADRRKAVPASEPK